MAYTYAVALLLLCASGAGSTLAGATSLQGRKLLDGLINVGASQLGQNLAQNLGQNLNVGVLSSGLSAEAPVPAPAPAPSSKPIANTVTGRKLFGGLIDVGATQLGQNLGQNLGQDLQVNVLGGGLSAETPVPAPAPATGSTAARQAVTGRKLHALIVVGANQALQNVAQNALQNADITVLAAQTPVPAPAPATTSGAAKQSVTGRKLHGATLIDINANQALQNAAQNLLQNADITVLAAQTPVPAPAPATGSTAARPAVTGRKLHALIVVGANQALQNAAQNALQNADITVLAAQTPVPAPAPATTSGAAKQSVTGRKLHDATLIDINANQALQNAAQNLLQNADITVLAAQTPVPAPAPATTSGAAKQSVTGRKLHDATLIDINANQALQNAAQNLLQNADITVLAAQTPVPAPAPVPAAKG